MISPDNFEGQWKDNELTRLRQEVSDLTKIKEILIARLKNLADTCHQMPTTKFGQTLDEAVVLLYKMGEIEDVLYSWKSWRFCTKNLFASEDIRRFYNIDNGKKEER